MRTTALLARQVPAPGLAVSADGYIRQTIRALLSRRLVHLQSGLDHDDNHELNSQSLGAIATEWSGYTEWASETLPSLSLGWDWILEVQQPHLCYRMIGEPRGNIWLIDAQRRDLSHDDNLLALAQFADSLGWQATVAESLLQRYR
jgi:hypothetical protein